MPDLHAPPRVDASGRDRLGPTDAAVEPDRVIELSRRLVVGELVSGAFHELNNALQVIGGLVELLGRRGDLPAAVTTKLDRIEAQTGRAAGTIAALQGLARQAPAAPVSLDLGRLAEETVALRRQPHDRAGIVLRVECRSGTPRARAERQAVQHALLAVLLNAEQAVDGRPAPEIVVRIESRGAVVALTVGDNGPGVRDAIRSRLFEAWFSTRPGAAGLGLWAARAAIERLGGTVDLCEAPGRGCGAGFTLALPAAAESTGGHATECSASG